MDSTEGSPTPEPNLSPSEADDLDRLEAVAQSGLDSYVQIGNALDEIRERHLYRESHPSFASYVRERWGVELPEEAPPAPDGTPRVALRHKPCEALARACEQTLAALGDDERIGIEVRFAVRMHGDPDAPAGAESAAPTEVTGPPANELVPTLRWLLTQAAGIVGDVGHQLETRAADIDDRARAQLRDDVVALDGELAVVKALLTEFIDWDSEFTQLLRDDPPPETNTDSHDDE